MRGISKRLLENVSVYTVKEDIVVWIIVYRSSDGYYNYKKVAVVITYPEDTATLYDEDSRGVTQVIIDTGAYQDIQTPEEAINAIKYIARKYGLHYRMVKLDWYYHFVEVKK